MDRQTLNQIVELAQRQLDGHGFECIEAEWVGNQRILRVFVEKIEQIDDQQHWT